MEQGGPNLHAAFGNVDLDDEDAVFGVLCALFLSLPARVRETGPQDVLKANGMCYGAVLKVVGVHEMLDMGITLGHAIMILRIIRPHVVQQAPPPANVTQAAPQSARVRCRKFPELQSSRLPTARAWRAFLLTFVTVLRAIGLPSPVPDEILRCGTEPTGTAVPVDPDSDQRVWDALLSIDDGVPDDLLLSLPPDIVVILGQGLGLLQTLARGC